MTLLMLAASLLSMLVLSGATDSDHFIVKESDKFLFSPAKQNWTEATKTCREYGSNLAYPNNAQELAEMVAIMDKYSLTRINAGHHDWFTDGIFYSVQGKKVSELEYNSWAPGFPQSGSANCGALQTNGLMNVFCNSLASAICEKDEIAAPGGFEDYIILPGHGYFKLFTDGMNWTQAFDTCYEEGSHLWIVNSQEELDAVFKLFTIDLAPVGTHRYFGDEIYTTIFGNTLASTGFEKFRLGEPQANNASDPTPVQTVIETGLGNEHTTVLFDNVVCEHPL